MSNKIWEFIRWHFQPRHIFTPFATINILHHINPLPDNKGFVVNGRQHIYIFGIRVACIQRTTPWEG
ncbi:hypothetical protein ACJJIG_21150 [Microbulbifer sp. SSSA007]|uniref:hypothetical protein n=1 Tax=Microbulbifer sp. SSSA007 TaxID=3243379 RepID=UPI004039C74B